MQLKLLFNQFWVSPIFLVFCSPFHGSSALVVSDCWWWVVTASRVLHQEKYSAHVDGFFFFPLGSVWDHFYMFANRLLHLCIFFTGSVSLHLDASAIVPSLYFSTLCYCFSLVNISFYIEQLPVIVIYIKL